MSLLNVVGLIVIGEEFCEVEIFIIELMKKKFRFNYVVNYNRYVIIELMNEDKGEVLGGVDFYYRIDVKGEVFWLYSNKYKDIGNIII